MAILVGILGVVVGVSLAIAGMWPRLISKRRRLVVPGEPRSIPLTPRWPRVGLGAALVVIGFALIVVGLDAFSVPR